MSPILAPLTLADGVASRRLGKVKIPVPSKDIAYLCVRKRTAGADVPTERG